MKKTRLSINVLMLSMSMLLVLSGCGPSKSVPRNFMRAIFSGNAKDAIEYLCVDGGVDAIVAIRADWSDDIYQELYSDEQSAQYLVSGRLIISTKNIEEYLPVIQGALIVQGYDIPDFKLDTDIGVGVQFGIDYKDFYLSYDDLRKEWCVDGESYYNFLLYLFEIITKEIV